MNKYYQLDQQGDKAVLSIYGDITSYPLLESDVGAYDIAAELNNITSDQIDVYINSYGGEVAEGLAIYNALRRHPAQVRTICDGFACSIASVIFMAGDERIMCPESLLMIHNAWTATAGDASTLRKQADDIELINSASKSAYLSRVIVGEDKLSEMMDVETWLTPALALEYGFATKIVEREQKTTSFGSQSAQRLIYEKIIRSEYEKERSEECERLLRLIFEQIPAPAEVHEETHEPAVFDLFENSAKILKKRK